MKKILFTTICLFLIFGLYNYSNSSYFEAYWGTIKGTLSNQTDLQDALNLKANISNVLELDNTDAFTPDTDYEPATKKYVDDNAGGVSDHGALTGLTDDDHTQYALLDGRSGGQVIYGGTGAGDGLALRTTSNATKGKIFFGSNSVYDEVNDRLGIGTTSPAQSLDVSSGNLILSNATNPSLYFLNTNNGFVHEGVGNTKAIAGGNEVWRWNAAGLSLATGKNLGVGTTNPEFSLDFNYTDDTIYNPTPANRAALIANDGIGSQNESTIDNAYNKIIMRAGNTDGVFGYVNESYAGQKGSFVWITENGGNAFSEKMRLRYDGNLGVGQITPTARTHIKGSTSDSSAYGLKVDDSSDAKNFYVRNDGQVELKNYTLPIADGTSGQVLKTDGAGSLSFIDTGSLLAYGEMYQNDNATATTINTVDVWEEVNNFSSGELNLVTFADSDLTVTEVGKYHLNVSLSGIPQTANHTFEFAISVNDAIVTKTKSKRLFSSVSDSGTISLNGIIDLAVNDVVKLELRNLTTGTNGGFTVQNCNLTLNKI